MSRILNKVYVKFHRLLHCESGQDLVEYGLVVTMLALACISAAQGTANSVNNLFGQVSQALDSQQQQGQGPPPTPPPPPPPHRHHGGGGGGWGWWHH
jgi:Flp pilus assembly pilin Flp